MRIFSFSQCPQTKQTGAKGCSREERKRSRLIPGRQLWVRRREGGHRRPNSRRSFCANSCLKTDSWVLKKLGVGDTGVPISFAESGRPRSLKWRAVHRVLPPPTLGPCPAPATHQSATGSAARKTRRAPRPSESPGSPRAASPSASLSGRLRKE